AFKQVELESEKKPIMGNRPRLGPYVYNMGQARLSQSSARLGPFPSLLIATAPFVGGVVAVSESLHCRCRRKLMEGTERLGTTVNEGGNAIVVGTHLCARNRSRILQHCHRKKPPSLVLAGSSRCFP
ncbi:hypothetical protein PIB30_080327, partial [Stylosanthes scabra]|nr:hypothetical protein [Stylosanthes scabra]